jgi:hypothetical protein
MNIAHTKLTDKIHLLTFETQRDITSTFLRFQEYYESPKFKGKPFSLNEFKKWYTATSPNGIKTGKFSYYSDWNGFNIPSYVLKPFYDGKFNPLSKLENKILNLFKDEVGAYYIIGIHKKIKKINNFLKHETAHGLFYTNDNYKNEVTRTLSKFNINPIKEELKSRAGYNEAVLQDEVHAYSLDSASGLTTPIPKKLSAKLNKIYAKYLKQK